ncbi:MAG TPA: inositol-3-phosphate synthase [Solirubrobacterales bacterium]|nr:inositol-3-phosphate synthase [Solirubrobacterales bacterium]
MADEREQGGWEDVRDRVDEAPVGLMVVGALGMSASAVIGGVIAMKRGVVPEQFGVTDHPAFAGVSLAAAADIELGGWDLRPTTVAEALRRHGHLPPSVIDAVNEDEVPLSQGLWTAFDYPLDEEDFARRPKSLEEGAGVVAADIETFRAATGAREVIVVFLANPSSQVTPADGEMAVLRSKAVPAEVMYAVGAADAGAHFVDFTPSVALEMRAVWSHAEEAGVQIAGRDGSTGQTMMKVTVAEMLARRGIHVDGWYSTNLLGNRDGFVLSSPKYGEPKIADKTDALHDRQPDFHKVSIEYLPPWGDAKEAWDAIECSTWLGAPLSIRIDWRGRDSQLAAPMVLDLVRLVHRGAGAGLSGFQPQLGYFFKRPYLREATSISERWGELLSSYT